MKINLLILSTASENMCTASGIWKAAWR